MRPGERQARAAADVLPTATRCCSVMRRGERQARAAAYERARPEILVHVPASARRVLDLGCATGATGAALKQRQPVHVTGIEVEPEYARRGARAPRRGASSATSQSADGLRATFDALIAADILEHLTDPWSALNALHAPPRPRRAVIVSLPNVGHWSTTQRSRAGRWPRKAEGIFDATHLRWFTLQDAARAAAPGGPAAAHRRAPRLDPARGSRLDALAPPLLRVPDLRCSRSST